MHRQLTAEVLNREVAPEEILPRFARFRDSPADQGVTVTPFGSTAARDLPETLLRTALLKVRKLSPSPIWLRGVAGQRSRLRRLAEKLRTGGVENVACAASTDAVEFAEAVARSELVLTAETATAHIAAAFDRPAVVLIGGGYYGLFGPWRRSLRQVWLTNRMDCFGCNWHCIHPEPYCLTNIGEDILSTTLDRLMERGARI